MSDDVDSHPRTPQNAEYVPDAEASDDLILDEQPYQVMDPLGAEAYSQLKKGIRKNGIQDPIHITPSSHIIDGHHRVLAWREIERDEDELDKAARPGYAVHDVRDTDVDAKRVYERMAWELNMQQRHLDDGGKKDAIERRLQQLDAEGRRKTDYAVAETLGVSASWVREVRHRLEGRGNIRTAADITTDTEGRRTKEDTKAKRAAVKDAIQADPTRSNRDIARELDVSHPFVGGVREDMQTPELPPRFADIFICDDHLSYSDETSGVDILADKTSDPEGWYVRLRERDFYEERDLIGRGLNEGWCLARRDAGTKHEAVETIEQFAHHPQRYATRKARQLREEGYEFEHTDLRQTADEPDVGGKA
jgi:ParB-like chromosome segregation protein Spo0J